MLRRNGHEFGTVTGRPRRCGWFDGVAARYAQRLNGLSNVAITKLDVLTGLERIGVVTGYRLNGGDAGFEAAADPALETRVECVEGWNEDLHSVRRIAELPASARAYVDLVARTVGAPVACVSVGPERSQLAL